MLELERERGWGEVRGSGWGRGWGPLFSGGPVGHRRRTLVGGDGSRRGGGALAGKVTPDAPIVGELGGNGKN